MMVIVNRTVELSYPLFVFQYLVISFIFATNDQNEGFLTIFEKVAIDIVRCIMSLLNWSQLLNLFVNCLMPCKCTSYKAWGTILKG